MQHVEENYPMHHGLLHRIFQAFSKRGRFVFRDALDDYHHDFAENNDDDFSYR